MLSTRSESMKINRGVPDDLKSSVPTSERRQPLVTAPPEPCDGCGYAHTDREQFRKLGEYLPETSRSHIADAMYEIVTHNNLLVYLCGHHFRKHMAAIEFAGYKVYEWAGHRERT
jgi:hypothetical protein